MRVLIVAESVHDWHCCQHEYVQAIVAGDEVEILALEPALQAHLRRAETPYLNSLHYFGKLGHENVLLASREMLAVAREHFDLCDELGLSNGYRNLLMFHLRFFIHYLLFLDEVISRCVEQHRPQLILAPERRTGRLLSQSEATYEQHLAIMAERVAMVSGVAYRGYKVQWRLSAQLSALWRRIGRGGLRTLSSLVIDSGLAAARMRARDVVLVNSRRYCLGDLVRRLQGAGTAFQPMYLNEPRLSAFMSFLTAGSRRPLFLGAPWTQLRRASRQAFKHTMHCALSGAAAWIAGRREVFRYRDVDVNDLAVAYLTKAGPSLLRDLHVQTHALAKLFDAGRPKAVLAQHALGWCYQLGEIAAYRHVPGLLISHGSHVPAATAPAAIEWEEHGLALTHTGYEYVAVQSPMAEAYYAQRPTHSRLIRTGPLLFRASEYSEPERHSLRLRLLPGTAAKHIVMHAGTPKGRQSRRLHVYETVDEYIENINMLIRAMAQMGAEYHLIVRFRETPDLKLADLQTLLEPAGCYTICTAGSFDQYLAISDLLISYSSTTIDEALFSYVPVVLFDPEARYKHIPGASNVCDSGAVSDDVCFYATSETALQRAIRHVCERTPAKDDGAAALWRRYRYPAALDGLRQALSLTSEPAA